MAMDSHEGCGIGKPTGTLSAHLTRKQRRAARAWRAYTDHYP